MAQSKIRIVAKEGAQRFQISDSDARAVSGAADVGLGLVLINQAVNASWIPSGASESERSRLVQAAMAALQGIGPTGELEGMLASQMVATHNAAMDCLRRAMLEGQTFDGREQSLKHAAKLLGIFARQVEALDKHRGKGQQKITVEHVTVNAGGQAIVGHVEGRTSAAEGGGLALSDTPVPLAPAMDPLTEAAPKQQTARR